MFDNGREMNGNHIPAEVAKDTLTARTRAQTTIGEEKKGQNTC